MADRASHKNAIQALDSFRRKQAAERGKLMAELSASEKVHHDWLAPKITFERLKNHQRWFETQSRVSDAELASRVTAAADPKIFAAIRALDDELEKTATAFSRGNSKELHPGKSYTANIDARIRAISAARKELHELVYMDVPNVDAAIKSILQKIPLASWS